MFLVGLPVQEVQVPLAALLGVAIDVCVVPLASLKVNPIQDSSVPCHSGLWCQKSHQTTVGTGFFLISVKMVSILYVVKPQSWTGFSSDVSTNADYTT